MTNYARVYDFSVKDALTTGDPLKKIQGVEVDDELDAIVTAVASKADTAALPTQASYFSTTGRLAPHNNLLIDRSSSTEHTATADSLVLRDVAGGQVSVDTWNITGDVLASGVNGHDTGVASTDTWWNLYAIYNSTSLAKASLYSLSATSPVLPTGYTHYALIGANYFAAGNVFRDFEQVGGMAASTRELVVNGGNAITYQAIVAPDFIPPIAQKLHFSVGLVSSIVNQTQVFVASTGVNVGVVAFGGIGGGIDNLVAPGVLALTTPQTFYYVVNVSTTSASIYVHGWEY